VSRIEQRLAELGLVIPVAQTPVGDYLGSKICENLLFVSGRVSELRGEVDSKISLDEARRAARYTVLQMLAIIRQDIGSLDRIESVEQLRGFVRSAPTFAARPEVIDGASDLPIELLGDPVRHARTATGGAQLPFGAVVQLDMVLRLSR